MNLLQSVVSMVLVQFKCQQLMQLMVVVVTTLNLTHIQKLLFLENGKVYNKTSEKSKSYE